MNKSDRIGADSDTKSVQRQSHKKNLNGQAIDNQTKQLNNRISDFMP